MKLLKFILAGFVLILSFSVNAQTTQIQSAYCGTTMASVSTYFYADNVVGATQYRFRLVNGATTLEVVSASRAMRFQSIPGFDYGLTYETSVAVDMGAGFGSYGASCSISSPPPISNILLAQYCGTTLSSIGLNLYASTVFGATQYRFTITDGINAPFVLTKSSRFFNMLEVPTYQYNTNYSVTVSYKVTEAVGFRADGPACSFTTPALASTKLTNSFCNTTIATLTTPIYADAVSGATQYRFKVIEPSGTYFVNKTSPFFILTDLGVGNYGFNEVYQVEVAAGYNNVFSSFGVSCNITTPAETLTKLQTANCGVTLTSISTFLSANSVSGATQYSFLVYRPGVDTLPVLTKNAPTRSFRFTEFASGSYSFGETYTVKVAVNVGNGFGSYGDACTVTLPGLASVGTTTMAAIHNNTTVENLQFDLLSVNAVANVELYEYRIVNGAFTATVQKSGTTVAFTEFAGYQYNTTYSMSVRIRKSGNWGVFGAVSTISTNPFPETYIQASQCNSTVASLGTRVYARGIGSAQMYKFKFIGPGPQIEYESVSRSFRFIDVPGLLPGNTYSISVAVKFAGSYFQFGDACNVTFPSSSSQIQSSQCGTTIASLSTMLYANTVTSASNYKFRVIKTSGGGATAVNQELTVPRRNFQLTELTSGSAQLGATYTVEVAAQVNGVFSSYGAVCSITTPPAITQLQVSQCGVTIPSMGTNLYANTVVGVSGYRFHVVKTAGGTATPVDVTLDLSRRYFNLLELGVGNAQSGATYSIEVSCLANGAYQAFGQICNVTAP